MQVGIGLNGMTHMLLFGGVPEVFGWVCCHLVILQEKFDKNFGTWFNRFVSILN